VREGQKARFRLVSRAIPDVSNVLSFAHCEARPLPTTPAAPFFPRRERFLNTPTADMKERVMSKPKIKWKNEPETEDYEGGKNLLTLICSDAEALQLIEHLQKSDTIERASKDLLRAADLPLLDQSDPHVREDLKRIHKGTPLPPVLLVCGEMKKGNPLIIVDGYHRICAVYSCDESASIPCRMATWDKI
jgi:hypothetical protein